MPMRADDELEIMRLLARLAQAVDDRDADAYRDCLADEVVCLVPDTSPNEVWRAVPSSKNLSNTERMASCTRRSGSFSRHPSPFT